MLPKFFTRTIKTEGSAVLYTRCARNGRNLLIKTPITVDLKIWNDCGRDLAQCCIKDTKGGAKILADANTATTIIRECVAENKTSATIAQELEDALGYSAKELRKKAAKAKESQLLPYFEAFVNGAQGDHPLQRKSGGVAYARTTIKRYAAAAKLLGEYLRTFTKKTTQFTFAEIDKKFALGFVAFLQSQNLQESSINCYCNTIGAICNRAAADGVNENAVSLRVWKSLAEKTVRPKITLTEEEVNALYRLPLQGKDAQHRDAFMLGILTGQRYSDYSRINPNMLSTMPNGEQAIELTQQKTKERVIIPLSIDGRIGAILARHTAFHMPATTHEGAIRRIMKKLSTVCSSLCNEVSTPLSAGEKNKEKRWAQLVAHKNAGKKLSDAELRSYGRLHEFAAIHGLGDNKSGLLWRRDENGNAIKFRWEMVSAHTARRTFVTLAIKSRVPDNAIMQISGHKELKTMQIYDKNGKEFHAMQAAEAFAAAHNKPTKSTSEIKLIS